MRWLPLVVALAGCGSVQNYPCETEGESRCEGADVAYCDRVSTGGLKWQVFPCGGGCDALRAQKCSWVGAMDGERCPLSIAHGGGEGFCSADGKLTFCSKRVETAAWSTFDCPLCVLGKRPEDVLVHSGDAGVLLCQ